MAEGNPGPGPALSGNPSRIGNESIRHQKILTAPEREAGTPAVRRYRPSRSWPVGGLALVAAAGAVLATGTLSASLDGGPEPAFAARIRQGVAGGQPGTEARAVVPATTATAAISSFSSSPPAPAEPTAAGLWQIQVGAFRNTFAAEAHVRALEKEVPQLEQLTLTHQLRGSINRVRIGGIQDEAAARELCARIRAVGRDCFVAGPEG